MLKPVIIARSQIIPRSADLTCIEAVDLAISALPLKRAALFSADPPSRIPPKSLPLFEMVVNAVHKAAPGATIAFNTRPEDTADAAARQLHAS
jgi:hypothetical protein